MIQPAPDIQSDIQKVGNLIAHAVAPGQPIGQVADALASWQRIAAALQPQPPAPAKASKT